MPSHSACSARVSATYSTRRSSCLRSRSSAAQLPSSSVSDSRRRPSASGSHAKSSSASRNVVANGRHTIRYCRPFALWMVTTLISASSLSSRTISASTSPATNVRFSMNHRISACSPSSRALAACSSSARCSTFVSRRSPPARRSQLAGRSNACSMRWIAASTPCSRQTTFNRTSVSTRASNVASPRASAASSVVDSPNSRVANAARARRAS